MSRKKHSNEKIWSALVLAKDVMDRGGRVVLFHLTEDDESSVSELLRRLQALGLDDDTFDEQFNVIDTLAYCAVGGWWAAQGDAPGLLIVMSDSIPRKDGGGWWTDKIEPMFDAMKGHGSVLLVDLARHAKED